MRTEKGQFLKGQSGNKNGKPKGTRNKSTLAALAMFDGESEALTRKAIELALEGDTVALRLCLERIAPPLKERPIGAFNLPQLDSQSDVLTALKVVAQNLSQGELLPSESVSICRVLEQYRKHYETTELAARLIALERTLKVRSK
jgi:hypothetical protein